MPENKPRFQAPAANARATRDTAHDFDDVTALFAPPPELLEQVAFHEEDVTAYHAQPRSTWDSEDDEATLAIPTPFSPAELEQLEQTPAPRQRPPPAQVKPPLPQPRSAAPQPRPAMPQPRAAAVRSAQLEIGDAELGKILGPRRAARWLALGGALTLVLVILAVARLAP